MKNELEKIYVSLKIIRRRQENLWEKISQICDDLKKECDKLIEKKEEEGEKNN
jgi:hypothetical protein